MRWDATGYGAHTEKATSGPAPKWYFAEGSQGFFSHVSAARESADDGEHRRRCSTCAKAAGARRAATTCCRLAPHGDRGATIRSWSITSFGMTVTFDQPGIAERAMYFGDDRRSGRAATNRAGVTAPSTTWFLAEGATGACFETFVLLANPNREAADVTLTFLPAYGAPASMTRTVPADVAHDDQHRRRKISPLADRPGGDADRPRRCR